MARGSWRFAVARYGISSQTSVLTNARMPAEIFSAFGAGKVEAAKPAVASEAASVDTCDFALLTLLHSCETIKPTKKA